MVIIRKTYFLLEYYGGSHFLYLKEAIMEFKTNNLHDQGET